MFSNYKSQEKHTELIVFHYLTHKILFFKMIFANTFWVQYWYNILTLTGCGHRYAEPLSNTNISLSSGYLTSPCVCCRYPTIQERIAQETDIPAGSQLILWHDKQLSDVVELAAAAQSFPKTITNTRLYVINKMAMETGVLKLSYIRKY